MPENHAGSKLNSDSRPVSGYSLQGTIPKKLIVFISAGYTAPSGKKQA